jgi:hypothetical protein
MNNTLTRIKVVTGHAAMARVWAEISEEPIGEIPRQPIPSPYSFSSTHYVYLMGGRPVIVVETRHMRNEIFTVDGPIGPVSE